MENKLPNAKFIRRDAVVKLDVPAGMIERIVEVLSYFFKQVSPEQIEQYQKELPDVVAIYKKEKHFSEEWMYPVTTISLFLEEIQKQADAQGQTFEGSIEDYFKNSVGDLTEENNPAAPQSQSQPE